MNRRLLLFSYVLAALTAGTLVFVGLHVWTAPTIELFGPLLGLAILGEELVVRQRRRSVAAVLSLSAPAHIAAAIALSPLPAALVAILALAVVDGSRRRSRRWLLLNASMFGLAAAASALAYQAAGGTSMPSATSAGAVGALLLTRFLLTTAILTVGRVLVAQGSIVFVLSDVAADELRAAVGDGSLGVLIAFGLSSSHWIVLPFLLPLVSAVYRSRATYEQLEHETRAALDSVAAVVDERHSDTAAHTERVKHLVDEFLTACQVPERQRDRLVLAARLHDIGKIVVDAATLSKDGPLSAAELSAIRSHPKLSARLLRSFRFAGDFASFVELHHERFDGKGYYGVGADDIPIESHVLIVADSFDAMTSRRPYRPALTVEEAVVELRDKAGTHFHPLVARAFAGLLTEGDIAAELSEDELQRLRAAFGRDSSSHVLALARMVDLRSTAVLAVAAGLFSLATAPTKAVIAVALVPTLAALCFASIRAWQSARRQLVIGEVLRRGGSNQLAALRAARLLEWIVWLHVDESGRYAVRHHFGGPPPDLSVLCGWAARRDDFVVVPTRDGHAALSARADDGRRVAIGFAHRPTELDRAIIDCIEAIPEPEVGSRRDVPPGSDRGHCPEGSAVLLLDLKTFDRVRQAAGQLVAERVTDDASEALRATTRADNGVARLSADEFGVIVNSAEPGVVEAVALRLRAALEDVRLPARVEPIDPLIVDVTYRPDGERVRDALEVSHPTIRAAGSGF